MSRVGIPLVPGSDGDNRQGRNVSRRCTGIEPSAPATAQSIEDALRVERSHQLLPNQHLTLLISNLHLRNLMIGEEDFFGGECVADLIERILREEFDLAPIDRLIARIARMREEAPVVQTRGHAVVALVLVLLQRWPWRDELLRNVEIPLIDLPAMLELGAPDSLLREHVGVVGAQVASFEQTEGTGLDEVDSLGDGSLLTQLSLGKASLLLLLGGRELGFVVEVGVEEGAVGKEAVAFFDDSLPLLPLGVLRCSPSP